MNIRPEEKSRISAWLGQNDEDRDVSELSDREQFALLKLIEEELVRRQNDPDHDFEYAEIPQAIHQVDQTMALARDVLDEDDESWKV